MLDLLIQFVLELARALLVEELSGRVRQRVNRWVLQHSASDFRRAAWRLHRRNRERLLNRLLTELEEDL